MARKLFCQLSPLCYQISLRKEYLLRDIKHANPKLHFARTLCPDNPLPCLWKGHLSPVMRQLHGVDLQLQRNKAQNLKLAAEKINGVIIYPGEIFSFWELVGPPTAKNGYQEGLTIGRTSQGGFLGSAPGGGLCQLANMIHWLILNSPLEVTELHHHSDALFPDERRRVPFGTGTSVFYKNIDYQFRNTGSEPVQLLLWLTETDLCGELRSTKPSPFRYRIVEEDHHFRREGEHWFRCSKIYRETYDQQRNLVERQLILDNHSCVMYDPALIPPDQIREG